MSDTPKKAGEIDWIQYRFNDLENGELFWVNKTRTLENGPIRKVDDNTALILRSQEQVDVRDNPMVYQKDY